MARAAAVEEQESVSFDPSTFSSGKWDGGRGTVTGEPRFEYRSFDGKDGKVTVIEAHFDIEDQEGNTHDVKWQAAYADNFVIKDSPDNGSEEAETGPAIANRTPGKKLRMRGDSELGIMFSTLQSNGYPGSRLAKGDLGVFVGLDADWVQFARKKDDKYPIMVVGEIFGGTGVKGATKPAPVASTKKAKDIVEEDDTPAPKKGAKGAAAEEDDADSITIATVLEALGDADDAKGEGTTVGDVIRLANKKLKGDPQMKKAVLDLLGDPADFASEHGEIKYKARTNSFVLIG
jgi:hypothetical protein